MPAPSVVRPTPTATRLRFLYCDLGFSVAEIGEFLSAEPAEARRLLRIHRLRRYHGAYHHFTDRDVIALVETLGGD